MLGQKVTPLDRVGIYVPGGKAAYPSSVLMNAIPARVAGVRKSSWWCPRRRRANDWCWPPRRLPA
jgi:histidinol dehydrogenase